MSTSHSVYRQVLGADFELLAPELQRFHSLAGRVELAGKFSVRGPRSVVGRLMAWLFALPRTTAETTFRFELEAGAEQETWRRHFPGRSMVSRMRARSGMLVERFGPVKFHFRLKVEDGRLSLRLQSVTVFGAPFPKLLMPSVTAEETGAHGKLHVVVAAHLPLIGLLTEYRGYLEIERQETGVVLAMPG